MLNQQIVMNTTTGITNQKKFNFPCLSTQNSKYHNPENNYNQYCILEKYGYTRFPLLEFVFGIKFMYMLCPFPNHFEILEKIYTCIKLMVQFFNSLSTFINVI